MATSTDYSGRSVDLLIFQGTTPSGEARIALGLGLDGGQVTTGIQKLAQAFTTLFLTRLGSVKSDPERGTEFMTAAQQGRLRDEAAVQTEFALATGRIGQYLLTDAIGRDQPDDEVFDGAVLRSFTVDSAGSRLVLSVAVASLAGAARTVFLPVPTAIK